MTPINFAGIDLIFRGGGHFAAPRAGHDGYAIRVTALPEVDGLRVELCRDGVLIVALEAPTMEELEALLIRCVEHRGGPIRSALRILGSEEV